MVDLLNLQKFFIERHLREGGIAVDFTMGNGHDTEFLCKRVGDSGHVYAFDVQKNAYLATEARLTERNLIDRCTLILDSHSNADRYISAEINAGVFNLGWLPGSGNKTLTTKRETTLPAVRFAVSHLSQDGILLIAVYPGHEEGKAEGEEIAAYLSSLDRRVYCVSRFQILNSPTSPYFMITEKKEELS